MKNGTLDELQYMRFFVEYLDGKQVIWKTFIEKGKDCGGEGQSCQMSTELL